MRLFFNLLLKKTTPAPPSKDSDRVTREELIELFEEDLRAPKRRRSAA